MIYYLNSKEINEGVTKDINEPIQKNWANDWLKTIEMNKLETGNDLTKPAQNSYLINRCVNIISQNFPQVPLLIYDIKTEDALRMDNPSYNIFNIPNKYMTYYNFWAKVSMFYTLYGESFIYMGKNQSGNKIVDMQVIDPRGIKEVLDDKTKNLIGWLFNNRVSLDLDEVIHIKNANPYSDIRGLSPLDAVEVELNSDYKASKYNLAFYKNGGIPSAVITTGDEETTVAEMRKIKRLWEKQHGGVSNAHKTAVLRGGMKLEVISLNQQEMEFINARNFTQEVVSSTMGVPQTILGITTGNRSIGDTERKRFWKETMKPQLLNVQYSLNRFYFSVYEPNLRCRFDYRKVDELQKDFGDDVKAAKELFQMGFSRNELNYRFDLGFDDMDNFGNKTYVPLNIIPQDKYEEYLASKTSIGKPIQDDNSGADKNLTNNISIQGVADFLERDKATITTKSNENKTIEDRANNLFDELQTTWEEKLSKKFKIYFYEQRKRLLKALYKDEDKMAWYFDVIKDYDIKINKLKENIELYKIKKNKDKDEINKLKEYVKLYESIIKEKQYFIKENKDLIESQVMNRLNLWDAENKRMTTIFGLFYGDMIKEGQNTAYTILNIDRHVELNKDLLFDRMNKITGINTTMYNKIRKSIHQGLLAGDDLAGIARRIKDIYNKVGSRVTMIARTESSAAINYAMWYEYKESGVVPRKAWITSKDDKVRPTCKSNAAQGVIPINQNFSSGQMYPDGVNCRCRTIPITYN